MAVRRSSARVSARAVHIERDHTVTVSGTEVTSEASSVTVIAPSQSTRKGKAKARVEPNPDDYERVASEWKIGAHVSAAGGVENAIVNAAEIGANAFALFLKSQRKWSSPNITDASAQLFKKRMSAFRYDPCHVLPHGSYLINLGNPDPEKREKAYECFVDDLRRCEQLGLTLYNFHPGSAVGGSSVDDTITAIAECINRAHTATSSVITVIENMAGAGNVIGSSFGEIASIIGLVSNKKRVGVCLDTCHMFAAGYDVRTRETYESTIAEFDKEVGLPYLRAMHINDSKAALSLRRDRHDNIGQGEIGLNTFAFIATDPRLEGIPLILETPSFECPAVWRKEIENLNRLSQEYKERGDDGEWMEGLKREIKDEVARANTGKAVKKSSRKRKAVVDAGEADDGGESEVEEAEDENQNKRSKKR